MKKLLLILSLIFLLSLNSCVEVEDGTVGISKSFGEISDQTLDPSVYVTVPIIREISVWNVKTQRRSLRLEIPSVENLIVGIEATALFRPASVVQIRKTIGENYVETVLDSTVINIFREVIGQERIENIVKEQEKVNKKIFERLKKELGDRGIILENLMITGLSYPQKFKEAIERKLEQEQKALQKQFELQQANKDAEIEVARAKGAAEAQEIVRSTLSAEYLQYLWISTLNENPNVIYVATEANMPMFRTTRGAETK